MHDGPRRNWERIVIPVPPFRIYDRGEVHLTVGVHADDIANAAACLDYHGPAPSGPLRYHEPPQRDRTVMGAW